MITLLGGLRSAGVVSGPKVPAIPPEPVWTHFNDAREVLGIGTVFRKGEPRDAGTVKKLIGIKDLNRKGLMIALLCSVPIETETVMSKLRVTNSVTTGSKAIIEGTIASQDVVLCAGGMGKVNAAHAATLLLTSRRPEALIIFGVGGAYASTEAKTGDLVLATEEIAGDEGVETADGFKDTRFIGIPLLKTATSALFNVFPASARLLDRSVQRLAQSRDAGRVHTGRFVTLSTCTGTSVRAKELENRYHGLCENMEGAAAAQVALSHEVPWLEVRGVSNLVQDRNVAAWDIRGAAEESQKAVLDILEAWNQ